MSNRPRVVWPLRPATFLIALGLSLGLLLLLPALALLVWPARPLFWLVAQVGYYVGGVLLGGLVLLALVLLLWGGALAVRRANSGPTRALGVRLLRGGLTVLGGALALVGLAYLLGRTWWQPVSPDLLAAAGDPFGRAAAESYWLFVGLGLSRSVWAVALAPLFLTALLALLTLLTLAGLLAYDGLVRRLYRLYEACPAGHVGRVVHYCPHCSTARENLRPSVYGVLTARCVKGHALPVATRARRSRLPRRCGVCHKKLEHPLQGRLPEYTVALWGPSGAGKTPWLRLVLGEIAEREGPEAFALPGLRDIAREMAERVRNGRDPGATVEHPPLAWTVAPRHGSSGRRLLHLFDLPGRTCIEADRASELPFFGHLSGLVLFLRVDGTPGRTRLQTHALEVLHNCWDRQRSARASRRHALPLAVLVLGLRDPASDPRAALVELDSANSLTALETRFHPVRYFAWSPGESALPVLRWLMERM